LTQWTRSAIKRLEKAESRKMGFPMRIFFAATIAAVLLTQTAYAQQHAPIPGAGPSDKEKAAALARRNYEKDTDEAYKSSLDKIPEGKKADPWGSLRTPAQPAGNK
jgi:hypothetical protein